MRATFGRTIGWQPAAKRPAEVRFDRFAIFGIGRELRLTAHERWLLVALCQLADYRTQSASATILSLSEDTGIGRDTVPKVLDALQRAGLVKFVSPFGPNRMGEVVILVWDQLITGSTNSGTAERSASAASSIADQSRTNRGPIAEKSANDQPEDAFVRNKAIRKEVVGAAQSGQAASAEVGADLFSVSDLSDVEIGLFPCDRAELDELLEEITALPPTNGAEGTNDSPALRERVARGELRGVRMGSSR